MDSIQPAQRSNEFSRNTLEKCFELLRGSRPSLALVIQNILMESDQRFPECTVALDLDEGHVSQIVEVLAEVGEVFAGDNNVSETELIKIRSILMDWMVYAQTFLDEQ